MSRLPDQLPMVAGFRVLFSLSIFSNHLTWSFQTIGGIVSKETVCCVGGKVKH